MKISLTKLKHLDKSRMKYLKAIKQIKPQNRDKISKILISMEAKASVGIEFNN